MEGSPNITTFFGVLDKPSNNMNELKSYSRMIKKEAADLLKETGLISYLQKKGDVEIVGSYMLDLMINTDIDIHIEVKDFTKKDVLAILNELIMDNRFRGYYFFDFLEKTRDGFPVGFYIGLKTSYNNRKWKLDLWFTDYHDDRHLILAEKIKKLNDEQNDLILNLKKQALDNNDDISSITIYEGVIKGVVSDYNSLIVKK